MIKQHSFINMTGNKKKLIGQIFSLLEGGYAKTNYVEPFFGSGGAYCNLPVKFEHYQCSDIFPFVIEFLNARYSVTTLSTFYDVVISRWRLDSHEGYYKFRDFWNQNRGRSDKFRNIGFVLLANACINGMMRFGPSGFNQSYGGRTMSKQQLCASYSWVRPNSVFNVKDFRDVKIVANSFVYLDPPYSNTGAMIRMSGFYTWDPKNDKELLNLIMDNRNSSSIVLSTLENSMFDEVLSKSGFLKYYLVKKYQVVPGKFRAKDYKEIFLTNIRGCSCRV